MTRCTFRYTAALLPALAFAGCRDEETAPEEGHTPAEAT